MNVFQQMALLQVIENLENRIKDLEKHLNEFHGTAFPSESDLPNINQHAETGEVKL